MGKLVIIDGKLMARNRRIHSSNTDEATTAGKSGRRGLLKWCLPFLVLLAPIFYGGLFWAFSLSSANWQVGAPIPLPRFEGPAAVVDGKLYVFGGFIDHVLRATNQAHVYDPALDRWSRIGDMPISVTHLNTAVDGQTIWFAGGFRGNHPGEPLRSVWKYDVASDIWSEGPPLPEARGGGGLVRVGRALHYIGGYYYALQEPAAADHWTLLLDGGKEWSCRSSLPVPRGHFGIVALDEKVYVIGGSLTHHPSYVDTALVHVYDPKQDQWKRLANLPSPRSHCEPGTFVFNGRIFIVGGRDSESRALSEGEMADITSYDATKDEWTELRSLPYPLRAPVAQVIGERLVVTTGSTFMAEKPQSTTLLASWTPAPGSICNPSGFEAFQLRFKGRVKSAFKSVARALPWRIQMWMGLERFVAHAGSEHTLNPS